MDKFLRFFIKFHGYCIAVASSGFSILFTSIFITREVHLSAADELINLRFTGVPVIVFGLAWMIASSLLVVGVFKERKQLLYPFLVLFVIDLALVIMRDIYLVTTGSSWYYTVFFNFCMPLLLFIVPYVVLTILALIKLFDIDPIIQAEGNFVRFDRNPSSETNLESVTIDS